MMFFSASRPDLAAQTRAYLEKALILDPETCEMLDVESKLAKLPATP